MHGLADNVLAEHWPERSASIAVSGVRRPPRALELDVIADTIGSADFSQQDRAAVAELWDPMAELMPCIGHRKRLGTQRHMVSGERFETFSRREPAEVNAELSGK